MKRLIALFLVMCSLPAVAATYSYNGNLYISHTDHTTCGAGVCADFTTAMRVTGQFTVATPLAPNLINVNIIGLLTGFSFFDGVNTYAFGDPQVRINQMSVFTDANGDIAFTFMSFQRWQQGSAGHVSGDHFNSLAIADIVDNNSVCAIVGVSPAGVADSCTGVFPPNTDASQGTALGERAWTTSNVTGLAVPTLSNMAILMLATALAALGLRRRRYAVRR